MSASVTSLYTAFAVEATYRFVPVGYFWWSTLGTSAIVFGVAGWVVFRHMGTYLPQQEQKWNQSPQRA